MSLKFTVTCADGLEHLLAEEIRSLGGSVASLGHGMVAVEGELAQLYACCLWSRVASRVLLPLFSGADVSLEGLALWAAEQPWEAHFDAQSTLAVRATLMQGLSWPAQLAALRLKDGYVDRMRSIQGTRPNVSPERPQIPLYLYADDQGVVAGLDVSGESLHMRSWRTHVVEAPLKETLAAAMLLWSGWPRQYRRLIDPMCGSGTLLLEAAMLAADIAPALERDYWGFLHWRGHDAGVWAELHDEAKRRADQGRKQALPQLIGYDCDFAALRAAQHNLAAAGFADRVLLERRSLAQFRAGETGEGESLLICNPPYGERLTDTDSARYLYRSLGRVLSHQLPGWKASLIAPHVEFLDSMGLEHLRTEKFNNGGIVCYLRHGLAHARPAQFHMRELHPLDTTDLPAPDLGARLRKNYEVMAQSESFRQQGLGRLYDADMPEYNVRIECLVDCVWVRENPAPSSVSRQDADARFSRALSTLRQLFGLSRDQVKICRAGGDSKKERQELRVVDADTHALLLDLARQDDCGADLEMRLLQQTIIAGRPRHVLHCWSGTGLLGLKLHMAIPSGKVVQLEDRVFMSRWARRQWALNGWPDDDLDLRTGSMQKMLAAIDGSFDVIVATPAESHFGQQKRQGFRWREYHEGWITRMMSLVSRDGEFWFAVNEKGFQWSAPLSERFLVTEESDTLLPADCQRLAGRLRFFKVRHLR